MQRDFWNLEAGEGKIPGPVMIHGQQYYLEAIRLPDALLLVVCSGKKGKGLEEYGGRWQTGLCLAKGFNLEDRHMTGSGEERQTDGRSYCRQVLCCPVVQGKQGTSGGRSGRRSMAGRCEACSKQARAGWFLCCSGESGWWIC